MFEDAEGFFGLEEVEGVDVVRDGDIVKFVRIIGYLESAGKLLTPLDVCYC